MIRRTILVPCFLGAALCAGCAAPMRSAAPPSSNRPAGPLASSPDGIAPPAAPLPDSLLTSVVVDEKEFRPASGERASIRIHLASAAILEARLYDEDDVLIRTLRPAARLEAGEHVLSWDGRDEEGRLVPAGAYLYTVSAVDRKGTLHLFDQADETAGRRLKVGEGGLDHERGQIRYSLPEAGRVRVRMDLRDGGPHLRTLVDWEARSAGSHEEPWNGLDASGEIDLREHPRATIGIRAYSLARNSILVLGEPVDAPPPQGDQRDGRPAERRVRLRPQVGDYLHASHPRASCHEPALSLDFPEDLPRDENGLPVAKGEVPLRLTVAPSDEGYLLDARFEIVVFVDETFLAEEEEGYNPFTILLDTSTLGRGPHLVTVNLVTLDDHIGVATRRFVVE